MTRFFAVFTVLLALSLFSIGCPTEESTSSKPVKIETVQPIARSQPSEPTKTEPVKTKVPETPTQKTEPAKTEPPEIKLPEAQPPIRRRPPICKSMDLESIAQPRVITLRAQRQHPWGVRVPV